MNELRKTLMPRLPVLVGVLVLLVGFLPARPAEAQPQTFTACYVPDVGAVYLIGIAGLPDNCLSTSHVEFSWTDGVIPDGSITTAKLEDGAVTSAKLAADAVASANVVDNSLTSDDLGASSVGSSELATGSVTEAKLGTLTDLEISSSGTNTQFRIVNTSSSGQERVDFIDAGGQQIAHIVVNNGSPSSMIIANNRTGGRLFFRTSGQTTMTDANEGNVGIGTSVPSNLLTVAQSSATDPIADAWTVYSSARWKTNIEPIEGALDIVQRLRGVSFDWKADGVHDIGLIAEEVSDVVPEVVGYEEDGEDARSVDYARLVAVLIEAVKEQQGQIEELRSAVAALSAEK